MTPRRPRAVLIAVLLLLALGLAGFLAVQAEATFRYHRATAERVLRDYARLAAARFAQRTGQQAYYYAFWAAVDALQRAKATQPHRSRSRPSSPPCPTRIRGTSSDTRATPSGST
jgi:Tfp pilus assembly protein PilV